MKFIGKVYIPTSTLKMTSSGAVERQYLWGQGEDVIVAYIKSEKLVSRPKKALRFSWVKQGTGTGWQPQMAIPKDVVEKDKLDIWAKCFESEAELREFSNGIINWVAWGIKGDRGRPGLGAFRA
jgi:hypothetical protein